ncbi:MAG: rhodanese-related sulfurtransferase [Actinobacteria bacterium]|nr:rhodanese-related sulfurtransferase [Actinomycetota bacterium]MTA94339.1 rhodanese-related sulfurtransferase [Actinomycetota bacterium]
MNKHAPKLNKVILYYIFTPIADPEAVLLWQKYLCQSLNLKGRILISKHGINGTVGGEMADVKKYVRETRRYPGFKKITFKWSDGTGNEFPRLRVVVKDELVAFGSPDEIQVDENGVVGGGIHLRPEQVEELVKERGDDVVFFDGRNAYEAKIGKFKNAIVPDVDTSRDFIREIESGKYDHIKDKPVVTYCTGGIRCEILSAVMKKRGFNEVYQIDGGIVKYGERFGDDANWEGSLYIFDDRMAMDFSDKAKVIGECEKCSAPTKDFRNCNTASCHQLILLCDSCASLPSNLSCTHDQSRQRDSELIG